MMPAAAPRILVHGHRGARAMRPENTLPAFQYAIGIGVDVLELDMAVTKDNVIVVSHDPYLHPPVCSGNVERATIHELTLAEVKQWDCGKVRNPGFPKQTPIEGTRMPTLEEVFALAPGNEVQFNIETKSFVDHPELTPPPEEFARMVLELVRKHKLEKRVMLQSFDFRTLRAMKKLAPEIRRVALWEGADRDFVSIAQEAEKPRRPPVPDDGGPGSGNDVGERTPWRRTGRLGGHRGASPTPARSRRVALLPGPGRSGHRPGARLFSGDGQVPVVQGPSHPGRGARILA